MAFPDAGVFTNDGAAAAALTSRSSAAGLDLSGLSPIAQLQSVVANLLVSDPSTVNIPAGNVLSGTFGANKSGGADTGAYTFPGALTVTGAATFVSSARSTSPTAGIGYATGAGGAQTQATDKSTTVVSNTITTAITMNGAALNLLTIVSFTFTNSSIAATDTIVCTHQSAGTSGAYTISAFPGAGSAVISVRNNTAGSLSEAIVIRVTVIKSVSA